MKAPNKEEAMHVSENVARAKDAANHAASVAKVNIFVCDLIHVIEESTRVDIRIQRAYDGYRPVKDRCFKDD